MAYMKISCEYCGGSWELYERDDWTSRKAATCPHCNAKISEQTWKGCIRAFDAFADANTDLYIDHVDSHRPLFQINMISDIVYEQQA